jgi:hypothetical protein
MLSQRFEFGLVTTDDWMITVADSIAEQVKKRGGEATEDLNGRSIARACDVIDKDYTDPQGNRCPSEEEACGDATERLFINPPPGIDAISDAKITRVGSGWVLNQHVPEGMCEHPKVMFAEMSIESYIRSCVQYDIDTLNILKIIKKVCGKDITEAAITFLKECDDLTVASIGFESTADSWKDPNAYVVEGFQDSIKPLEDNAPSDDGPVTTKMMKDAMKEAGLKDLSGLSEEELDEFFKKAFGND